jgi:glycosyltransferase 2 family protein
MGTGKVSHRREVGTSARPAEAVCDRTLPDTIPPTRRQETPESADRVRRPADLLLAVIAFLIIAVVLGTIRALPLGTTEAAHDVYAWLLHIPRWLSYTAAVASEVACFGLAVAALAVLARGSEWREMRNAVAAGLAGAATAIIASAIWREEHATVQYAVLNGSNPTTLVVCTAFVAFVVGTDLSRLSHWSRWWPCSGAALLLSGLAVGTLTPFAVVVAAFGGLLVGWVVRWGLGAASVLPGTAELTGWLASRGVPTADLSAVPSNRARLEGMLTDGTRIRVQLSGRDTHGSGLLRQLWALVRLRRAVAGRVAPGTRAQVEQLALACCLAQQASVPSPAVLLLGEMPDETLVLVTSVPAEPAGPETASVPGATSLFASLRRLHDTGVAHRDLRPGNVFMSGNRAGFCSLEAAEPAASDLTRRLDLVQVLATLAETVGSANAVKALRAGYGNVDETAVAAVVQPLALAPWGWSAMRAAGSSLSEIRHDLIGGHDVAPPTRLARFRWRTVATTVALTIAAYLLVAEISGVNVLSTLSQANPAWLAVAVLGSAVTFLGAAINVAAFIPKRLSIWRGFFVQLATAFVGVAMPPTVGHLAVNARYLHRQQVEEGTIAAAVTISQLANILTTMLLLIVLGVLTGSGFSRLKIVPSDDILIGLGVIVVVLIVVLSVPQTRALLAGTVWPQLRAVWPRLLDAGSHPVRLAVSVGANLLLSAAYVVAIVAALRSVGAHPPILPVAVVFLAGNAVGSATPTPGGLGGVEAVLVAGVTAIGIPAAEAIPAVLIFRLATFWLPIPAGWVSYLVLQRHGTL